MKISLRTKTFLLIIIIAAILSTVGVIVSSRFINQLVDDEYRQRAKEITDTVAVTIDADRFESLADAILEIYNQTDEKVISDEWGTPEFDKYIANFSRLEESEDFQALRNQLRKIQDVNDVDCLYLILIDAPTKGFIYAVDAAYEDACPPGCLDPIYDENRELLTNPARGFPPYLTNTETYGWLVTAGASVYNEPGKVIGYAMADISMEELKDKQSRFIWNFTAILALLTALICIVSIWIVNLSIIRPINRLSNAAASYSAGGNHEPNYGAFDNVNIKTKDEIGSLFDTMKSMLSDMNGYIDTLKSTTQELSRTRIEANEMDELAHVDLLTGVRNKNAYNEVVAGMDENLGAVPFGIAVIDLNDLKRMNDLYGHDKGDQAIKNICSIICDVFQHSPVYRFGGDEFVVILKERDYENVDDLVRQFTLHQERRMGMPWEKPKAAIGYAVYDSQKDSSVESVFQRADAVMYERKKEMKEEKN